MSRSDIVEFGSVCLDHYHSGEERGGGGLLINPRGTDPCQENPGQKNPCQEKLSFC